MDSKSTDLVVKYEPEAALWAWSSIWSKEDVTHSTFDILDVMLFNNEGDITGWLFTASDKTVKCKIKKKWTIREFIQKNICKGNDGKSQCLTHVRTSAEWRTSTVSNQPVFDLASKCEFIIGMANKGNSSGPFSSGTLIEQQVDIYLDSMKPTKTSTYRLINKTPVTLQHAKVSNSVEDYELFPQLELNRVLNRDKRLNERMKSNTLQLVKLLETREGIRIQKLRLIYAFDSSVTVGEEESEGRIWLHHVAEVEYFPKSNLNMNNIDMISGFSSSAYSNRYGSSLAGSSMVGSKIFSIAGSNISVDLDRRSMATSLIRSDHSNRGQIKHLKCCGDFCSFTEDEELSHMQSDIDFDLAKEAKKAKQRHRKLTAAEQHDKKTHSGAHDLSIKMVK